MQRAFTQVDVFTETAYQGNPLAVVLDGTGLSSEEMQHFAHWTNLSETTFVLPPTSPEADYRCASSRRCSRLPFAGHPTLGTCHAWLRARRDAAAPDVIVQECGVGLVAGAQGRARLAFAAPPLLRSGALEEELDAADRRHPRHRARRDRGRRLGRQRASWIAVLLADADAVLAVRAGLQRARHRHRRPAPGRLAPGASRCARSSRRKAPSSRIPSPAASTPRSAQWLLRTGRARAPYVAGQGTVLGRSGRVHVSTDADGPIWVGGGTVACITGTVDLYEQKRREALGEPLAVALARPAARARQQLMQLGAGERPDALGRRVRSRGAAGRWPRAPARTSAGPRVGPSWIFASSSASSGSVRAADREDLDAAARRARDAGRRRRRTGAAARAGRWWPRRARPRLLGHGRGRRRRARPAPTTSPSSVRLLPKARVDGLGRDTRLPRRWR